MSLLLLVKLTVVESLFLEVVDFDLEGLDLLVFLHFKLLAVDLVLEVAQLAHHELHVPAVRAQKVLFLVSQDLLADSVDRGHLLVDHV